MSEFELVTAWRRDDGSYSHEAAAFWKAHGFLDPEQIADNVHALCSLAYAGGRLVGASTVELRKYPPLRSRFAFCSCAVAPLVRRRGLATLLIRHSLAVMEGWSLEHPDEGLRGLAVTIKTRDLEAKTRHPVWSEHNANLNLVGFTPAGGQVRVAWFRHAELA